ncbi:hypothetical protein UlMin_023567 [Ulmus minor]
MAYQEVPGPSSGLSSSSRYQYLNSPFGDTSYSKVFVGNLAWEIFGDILKAVVNINKNTGQSKGYNFVTFRELEAARKAYADLAPIIDGRRANCNLASLGRPRPPMPYGCPRLLIWFDFGVVICHDSSGSSCFLIFLLVYYNLSSFSFSSKSNYYYLGIWRNPFKMFEFGFVLVAEKIGNLVASCLLFSLYSFKDVKTNMCVEYVENIMPWFLQLPTMTTPCLGNYYDKFIVPFVYSISLFTRYGMSNIQMV